MIRQNKPTKLVNFNSKSNRLKALQFLKIKIRENSFQIDV